MPSSSGQAASSGDSGLSTGAIGGIVGGILGVFLLTCIVIIFFLVNRRKQTAIRSGAPSTSTELVASLALEAEKTAPARGEAVGGRLSEPEEPCGGRLRYPNDEIDAGGRLNPNGTI
jgi:hypothetical protein